jgi:phosphatidylethanolamine/phosphatidyl-N-methylethanolamine N-methyltransferase
LAWCYNPIFKGPLSDRIHRTIGSLKIPAGAQILDVGVGTGHYLAAYPRHANVIGIDLSPDMLKRAEREIERYGLDHIELRQMDALDLQFPADSFEYVMGFHTASVVADPQRLIDEMLRVCRPGGRIVVINHLRTSRRRWLVPLSNVASALTRPLGWHVNVSFDDLFEREDLTVERRSKSSPWSPFTVVVAKKRQ